MKQRPILFKGEMVRAILSGQKTQTRRPVKKITALLWLDIDGFDPEFVALPENHLCPYGNAGDQLWVRETWMEAGSGDPGWMFYKASDYLEQVKSHGLDRWVPESEVKWKPSIFMPRAACRIMLEITNVRVERLRDISEADAIAEGIKRVESGYDRQFVDPDAIKSLPYTMNPILSYRGLWESINGPGSWDANPWVWVVEFRRI